MHLEEIFYESDEFCKDFEKQFKIKLLTDGEGKRKREFALSLSEIMTIMICYHESGFKTFKDFYEKHVLVNMKRDFPKLVSYNRFVELRQKALFPLFAFAQLKTMATCTGKSFIDSFPLEACHIKRTSSHKVFKGFAKKGKTSMGWFYGFKLHLVINLMGEIIAFCITPGNVADNNKTVLLKITKKLFGKLFGDKGYLVNKDLFRKLYLNGVEMVTRIRANMANKIMHLEDKLLLRKRGLIESVGNILKGSLSLEHSRHRSVFGFCGHIIAAIVAYCFRENKPSIMKKSELEALVC
jgi:hypothetical protein